MLGRLAQTFLAVGHRTNLAREPQLAEAHEAPASGSIARAGNRREHGRQIGGGLRNAHAADDVDENVAARGRNAAVPMQHCKQQRETVRFQADGDAARIHALRVVGERLHFDEHRPAALARHHHCAAADGLRVLRKENRRRVLHFLQALFGHREHADFVGGAEAILDCAHQPEAAAGIAFEVQHRVHHVLEDARTRDHAFLRHVADEQHRHARRFGEAHQRRRGLAHLRGRSRRGFHFGGEHRLDGVDDEHARARYCARAR